MVRKIISNIWRRNIPKTSFAVREAAAGDLGLTGPAILLEAIGFSSAIIIPIQNYPNKAKKALRVSVFHVFRICGFPFCYSSYPLGMKNRFSSP
jgi:hypothetical protein